MKSDKIESLSNALDRKIPMWLAGKELLITGGTGSLGKTIIKQLLARESHLRPRGIRVFSRDELKQWELAGSLLKDARVSFLIGDISNQSRLERALDGVDAVIHTAAMKQVPACESNPLEALRTNVTGAESLINASINCGVKRVLNVSTDKAVNPINFYGATKMMAEHLFANANIYTGDREPRFASVRYGNVLASRGSVAHVFKAQVERGEPITITHSDMTRFWITLNTVTRFLIERLERDMSYPNGQVYIPVMSSMSVRAMAVAMAEPSGCENSHQLDFKVTGVRDGEKLHESLMSAEESEFCEKSADGAYFIIDKRRRILSAGTGKALTSADYLTMTGDDLRTMLEGRG